jgi:hypothetical protein
MLLLSEAVDDYVAADNPVRFIDAFVDGSAGRAAMLPSLAAHRVQFGESALVAGAPGRDAVAQPVLLHRDLTAKLMLLVGFLTRGPRRAKPQTPRNPHPRRA